MSQNHILNATFIETELEGHGPFDRDNNLFLFENGFIYERHDRIPPVPVNGNLLWAAQIAVDAYNRARN